MKNKETKNNTLIIILLIIIFVLVFLAMQRMMDQMGDVGYQAAIRDPISTASIVVYDLLLGGIMCYLSKLISEKKMKIKKVLKILGLWNIFGGILMELISIIIFIIDKV